MNGHRGLFGAKFKTVSSRSHPLIVKPNSLILLGVHGRVKSANLSTYNRRVKSNASLAIVIFTLDQRQLPLWEQQVLSLGGDLSDTIYLVRKVGIRMENSLVGDPCGDIQARLEYL